MTDVKSIASLLCAVTVRPPVTRSASPLTSIPTRPLKVPFPTSVDQPPHLPSADTVVTALKFSLDSSSESMSWNSPVAFTDSPFLDADSNFVSWEKGKTAFRSFMPSKSSN